MRTKIKFHHLLLIGVVTLGSCQKDYVIPKPPTPPPLNVSYSTDIAPTFAASCLGSGCHSAGEMSPDLSSPGVAYTSLTTGTSQTSSAAGPYIDTVNAANSVFYIRIHTNSPDPQMPDPASPLSSDYQAKVLSWIQKGAKNN